MDSKLMEMKLWNGTHAKHISFKKTNSEVKLGSLYVDNINVEARYDVLENLNVMENFRKEEETCNVKDYSLVLTAYGKNYL